MRSQLVDFLMNISTNLPVDRVGVVDWQDFAGFQVRFGTLIVGELVLDSLEAFDPLIALGRGKLPLAVNQFWVAEASNEKRTTWIDG